MSVEYKPGDFRRVHVAERKGYSKPVLEELVPGSPRYLAAKAAFDKADR